MNVIILCEGETDQIILSEYFCHMYGFQYVRQNKRDKGFHWPTGCRYIHNDVSLDIVYVGGNQFSEFIEKILTINRMNSGFSYSHVAVISDHDSDKEIQERWHNIAETISTACHCDFQIAENHWIEQVQQLDFDESIAVHYLFLSIPLESDGALETFLLNAMENEPGNVFLSQQSKQFVKDIIEKKTTLSAEECNPKYLAKRRTQIKAPLAVFFALAWPDRAFADAKALLQKVPWAKYEQIQTSFRAFEIFKVDQ